jgi:hypothetical protein
VRQIETFCTGAHRYRPKRSEEVIEKPEQARADRSARECRHRSLDHGIGVRIPASQPYQVIPYQSLTALLPNGTFADRSPTCSGDVHCQPIFCSHRHFGRDPIAKRRQPETELRHLDRSLDGARQARACAHPRLGAPSCDRVRARPGTHQRPRLRSAV